MVVNINDHKQSCERYSKLTLMCQTTYENQAKLTSLMTDNLLNLCKVWVIDAKKHVERTTDAKQHAKF